MDELIRLLFINTLGESVLVETLKSAAYFVMRSGNWHTGHHNTRSNFLEGGRCYFFIQSTKLDVLIQTYGLSYDPEELREEFHYLISKSSNSLMRQSA